MRELKFRAWVGSDNTDRVDEEMHYEYGPCLLDGKYADVSGYGDIYGTYEEVPVEQYTGLKDKNGREIYEGDIVGDIEGIHELAICVWDDSNAEFDFVCVDGKCTKDNVKSWLEMYEIIGNIHENKELLGEK